MDPNTFGLQDPSSVSSSYITTLLLFMVDIVPFFYETPTSRALTKSYSETDYPLTSR